METPLSHLLQPLITIAVKAHEPGISSSGLVVFGAHRLVFAL
jgi:hypothetical protein